MHQSFKPPGKPANITLPIDQDRDAKDINITIPQSCEASSRNVFDLKKRARWTAENAEFIAEYNKRIEVEGSLLQEWNTF